MEQSQIAASQAMTSVDPNVVPTWVWLATIGAIALIYLWHPAARPWFHPFASQEARS